LKKIDHFFSSSLHSKPSIDQQNAQVMGPIITNEIAKCLRNKRLKKWKNPGKLLEDVEIKSTTFF